MKDKDNTELDNSEYIKLCYDCLTYSDNRGTKKRALGIIQIIDDSVFICTCKVFSDSNRKISHPFFYDSHLKMIECCCAIIDNRYHAPIFLLESKHRKT